MFKIYILKKFALSTFFSLTSTKVLYSATKHPQVSLHIEEVFADFLFLLFLFSGLAISSLHEYYNKKKDYKFGVGLIAMSILITIVCTLLIWVLYQGGSIPEKAYYGAVLFSSVFSSGIVRYLLVHMPARLGGNILKLTDKLSTDKKP